MKYKKYFRKTSLKQKDVGDFFLDEISKKKPKIFLEVGVFHGVTARNICELLYQIHKDDFRYIGLDLFEKSSENANEIIPQTKFSNPFKSIYFKYIKRQDPYSKEAVEELLSKFKKLNCEVYGISKDSIKSHDKFREKYKIKFDLLSDEETKVLKKYKVWAKKKFMGREFMGVIRSTFLIDKKGKTLKVWNNVKVKDHAKEVLKTLESITE